MPGQRVLAEHAGLPLRAVGTLRAADPAAQRADREPFLLVGVPQHIQQVVVRGQLDAGPVAAAITGGQHDAIEPDGNAIGGIAERGRHQRALHRRSLLFPALATVVAAQDLAELAHHHQRAAVKDGDVVPGQVFLLAQTLPGLAVVLRAQQRPHLAHGDRHTVGAGAHAIELVGHLRARHVVGLGPVPAAVFGVQDHVIVADRHGMQRVERGDVLQRQIDRCRLARDLAVLADGQDLAIGCGGQQRTAVPVRDAIDTVTALQRRGGDTAADGLGFDEQAGIQQAGDDRPRQRRHEKTAQAPFPVRSARALYAKTGGMIHKVVHKVDMQKRAATKRFSRSRSCPTIPALPAYPRPATFMTTPSQMG